MRWEGTGVQEKGIIKEVMYEGSGLCEKRRQLSSHSSGPKPGDVIVRVDSRYFRPTEVETLLGDPANAKNRLGWEPKITFEELVREMVCSDLEEAQRDALCETEGFKVFNHHE